MKNHYEVLGINQSADEKQIKKAYTTLLRKYPPEKCPQEFKEIREAYEILANSKTKAEYDAMSQYGDQIEEHLSVGRQAMEDEDYKKAMLEFKKILLIEPSLSFARNLLGLALLYNDEVDAAITQFEKLVQLNSDNAVYYANLGGAYKKKKEYTKAEQALIKAHKLDTLSTEIIIDLSNLYVEQKQYDKSISILRQAIEADGSVDFEDFMYFFEMVEVYVVSGDIDGAEKVIDEIEKILPDNKEIKEYVAWKFAKLAYQLYEVDAYSLAERISQKALEINPNEESIKELNQAATKNRKSYELLNKLTSDERIAGPIKGPIFYYMRGEDFDKDELEESYEKNFEAIQSYIDHSPNEVVDSINLLRKEYTQLYEYRKNIYDEVYEMAQKIKRKFKQWEQLKNDSTILNCFKRLIALWLTDDMSDAERKRYFDDIVKELGNQANSSVVYSLSTLKTKYPDLYNINSEFMEKIDELVKKNLSSSTTNTTSSSYQSTSYSSSSSSSGSGGSSCFVATAAFGTPWVHEINILREWRDTVLTKSIAGRLFIRFYYIVGPYLAILVENSEFLKKYCRKFIRWIIAKINCKT